MLRQMPQDFRLQYSFCKFYLAIGPGSGGGGGGGGGELSAAFLGYDNREIFTTISEVIFFF